MCLTIENKHSEPLIASADIVVYKVLEDNHDKSVYRSKRKGYYTPFYAARVKLGRKYTSSLSFDYCGDISKGLHSFKTAADAEEIATHNVENGLVVKCLIPKGSKYYEGKFGKHDSLASNVLCYRDQPSYLKWLLNKFSK